MIYEYKNKVLNLRLNDKGASGFESFIIISIVGLLVAIALGRFYFVIDFARETALKAELAALRSSLNLFKIVENRMPEDLIELENKEMEIELGGGKKLSVKPLEKKLKKDEKGRILDPFGNPYSYERKRGKISAVTKGYENW